MMYITNNHEVWATCPVCGYEYDRRVWDTCPRCAQLRGKSLIRILNRKNDGLK